MTAPIIEVKEISKSFPVKNFFGKTKGVVSAVDNVSFHVFENKTLGIVGESGCGKSTLGRLLLRLIESDSGQVQVNGNNILSFNQKQMKLTRKDLQIIFQDPYSSLNPHMTILENVQFPLLVNGYSKKEAKEKAIQMLEACALSRYYMEEYPGSLSGGQRQRVAIARALVLEPKIVIADEPVSALDKSVQAQVLNLLLELKKRFSLTLIFISHDLHVVEYMSDYVMVMYLGRIVEYGPAEKIYSHPYHPYTKALLNATPSLERKAKNKQITLIEGELPSPLNPPSGCRFRTRCPEAMERCANETPAKFHVSKEHEVACFLHES